MLFKKVHGFAHVIYLITICIIVGDRPCDYCSGICSCDNVKYFGHCKPLIVIRWDAAIISSDVVTFLLEVGNEPSGHIAVLTGLGQTQNVKLGTLWVIGVIFASYGFFRDPGLCSENQW